MTAVQGFTELHTRMHGGASNETTGLTTQGLTTQGLTTQGLTTQGIYVDVGYGV